MKFLHALTALGRHNLYQRSRISRIQLCLTLLEALNKYFGVSIRALRFIIIRNIVLQQVKEDLFLRENKSERVHSMKILLPAITDWLIRMHFLNFNQEAGRQKQRVCRQALLFPRPPGGPLRRLH